MENLIIIGLSITADTAYDFVTRHNLYNIVGFAVNREYLSCTEYKHLPVYALEDLPHLQLPPFKVFVAVLWNRLNADRRHIFEQCHDLGLPVATLVSPTATICSGVSIGENCWIHDMSYLYINAKICDNSQVFTNAYVGADTIVGPHCHCGTHSMIAGGCVIGEQSFIGANATIFHNVKIGEKCIIGATTAIKRNLPPYTKCIANPTDTIIRSYDKNEIEHKLLYTKDVR